MKISKSIFNNGKPLMTKALVDKGKDKEKDKDKLIENLQRMLFERDELICKLKSKLPSKEPLFWHPI